MTNTPEKCKWENPEILFCYTHRIDTFIEYILPVIKNPFKLITHNSDHTIQETHYIQIAKHPLFIKGYAQNIEFSNISKETKDKLHVLPIGFANGQWQHGNMEIIREIIHRNNIKNKQNEQNENKKSIYFNFNVHTSPNKRVHCRNILINKGLKELENADFKTHLQRLSTYEYCICPEGNGPDTHRLWECIYLDVIPIVLNTPFIQTLRIEYGESIPLVILEKWEDFDADSLPANVSNFETIREKISQIKQKIMEN